MTGSLKNILDKVYASRLGESFKWRCNGGGGGGGGGGKDDNNVHAFITMIAKQ
jgi:hypothetical protein